MAPPLFHSFLQKGISHWGKLDSLFFLLLLFFLLPSSTFPKAKPTKTIGNHTTRNKNAFHIFSRNMEDCSSSMMKIDNHKICLTAGIAVHKQWSSTTRRTRLSPLSTAQPRRYSSSSSHIDTLFRNSRSPLTSHRIVWWRPN